MLGWGHIANEVYRQAKKNNKEKRIGYIAEVVGQPNQKQERRFATMGAVWGLDTFS